MKYDMKHAIKEPEAKPKKSRIVLILSLSAAALILAGLIFFNFGAIRSFTGSLAAKVFTGPAEEEEETKEPQVQKEPQEQKEPLESIGKADEAESTNTSKDAVEPGQNDGSKTTGSTEETGYNYKTQVTAKDTAETSNSTEKMENTAPQIKAVNLSSNIIYVSRQYSLTADVTDPDGDTIQYDWSANAGLIAQNSTNPAKWTSPDAPGEYSITLVASDNHGNKSSPYTIKVSVKAEVEQISSSTSIVGYQEVSTEQLVSLFIRRNPSKAERAARLAPIYINYGKLFNIRADIAWAQMCHETDFLEYTGDVKPGQNNFAGIGATGGGEPGNSFATEELGIIAHYAHLAWYCFPDHVSKYCSPEYDPRHFDNVHKYYTGDTSLGFLNGRWATDANYADKIAQFANEIYGN